jgi:large subunit ribosomal protein L25
MSFVLPVQPRTAVRSGVKRVRRAGWVPGVMYGQGQEAVPIQFKELDLVRLLRSGGSAHLIELHGLGPNPVHVLLREVQRHPTRHTILHADFYRVRMDKPVRAEVPVHFTGESEAIRGGAVLIHHLDRIEVECLPADIPEAFVVDLSKLVQVDDVIRVADLAVPPRVTVQHEADEIVVSLSVPRAVAVEEEGGEPTAAEPEVIRKGKAEKEAEAEA